MAAPMLLELSKIQSPRERVDHTWPPAALDTRDDEFDVVEPIALQLEVQKVAPDRFRLVGRAATTLEVSCSRCAEPFRIRIDVPFDLSYLPQADNQGDGEREVQEDDLSTSFYHGGAIDLSELMREQFYLALPMKPLCTDDCRGLCPHCGTNLNRGTCDCNAKWEDPRLSALRALLEREKND